MGNVEVRKNKEGYELNLNTLIYSELLMRNVSFFGYEPNLPCSAVKCVARKDSSCINFERKKE